MTDNMRMRLGKKAKELRKAAKMTQQDVADRLGIRRADVSSFETRGEVIGSIERINALFEIFGYELNIAEKKTFLTLKRKFRAVLTEVDNSLIEANEALRPGTPAQHHKETDCTEHNDPIILDDSPSTQNV